MASCDRSLENATAATNGICPYYDVTSSDCQRNATHDSADTDGDVKMFGRHTCQVPTNIKASDMYVRYRPPETSGASGVQTAPRIFALLAAVGTFAVHSSTNHRPLFLYALCAVFIFAVSSKLS
jgi:hypothetical protein